MDTNPLQQASFLAKVSDTRTVVVGKHFVAKDSIRHLGRVHQVHLEETSLKMTLFGLVLLERIKKERRRGLDHVLGHEDINHLGRLY